MALSHTEIPLVAVAHHWYQTIAGMLEIQNNIRLVRILHQLPLRRSVEGVENLVYFVMMHANCGNDGTRVKRLSE